MNTSSNSNTTGNQPQHLDDERGRAQDTKRASTPRALGSRKEVQKYVDHSNDPIRCDPGEVYDAFQSDFTEIQSHTRGNAQLESTAKPLERGLPFPDRLHAMLNEVEDIGLNNIISWCSHGRAFRVSDRLQFEVNVMPRYDRFSVCLVIYRPKTNI